MCRAVQWPPPCRVAAVVMSPPCRETCRKYHSQSSRAAALLTLSPHANATRCWQDRRDCLVFSRQALVAFFLLKNSNNIHKMSLLYCLSHRPSVVLDSASDHLKAQGRAPFYFSSFLILLHHHCVISALCDSPPLPVPLVPLGLLGLLPLLLPLAHYATLPPVLAHPGAPHSGRVNCAVLAV